MGKRASFTLNELAQLTGATIVGDHGYHITGFSDLESACETDISFLSNPRYTSTRYLNAMRTSKAGAIFVTPLVELEAGKNYLVHTDPTRAFQTAIEAMRGGKLKKTGFVGIHPTAVVHESAKIGPGVTIAPNAVIDEDVIIGEGSFVGAGAYIGPGSRLGKQCTLHPRVTIREFCTLGDRVILQPGCVIGACGFGYTTNGNGEHERLAHIGTVVIGDDVEIGANTTVDRARFTETRIGRGTKIDNSVAIGHNVKVGAHNLICAQSGIAGSTHTESHVVIAAQSGVDGHLTLRSGVIVTAKSGVSKSLEAGKYGGVPAIPLDNYNRNSVHFRNFDKTMRQIKDLSERLAQLEASNS